MTGWSDPNSDPMGDLRRYMDLAKEVVTVTQIEVNAGTFLAIQQTRSAAQRDALLPGLGALYGGVPVFLAGDVPDAKASHGPTDGSR